MHETGEVVVRMPATAMVTGNRSPTYHAHPVVPRGFFCFVGYHLSSGASLQCFEWKPVSDGVSLCSNLRRFTMIDNGYLFLRMNCPSL